MKQYIERLKNAAHLPDELSKLHLELAYYHAELSEQLVALIDKIIARQKEFKENEKSVAAAVQAYKTTDEHKEEWKLKVRIDSVEKLLSSIRRRLETLDTESRNQY